LKPKIVCFRMLPKELVLRLIKIVHAHFPRFYFQYFEIPFTECL
jgi:hypothetical protein